MSRRGRGGRGGFGRRGGPSSGKDLIGETMEDLGLNHEEMESSMDADALFPTMNHSPGTVRLTDEDAYLIQKQRELMHGMDLIFERDRTLSGVNRMGSKLPFNFQVVVPNATTLAHEIYLPLELIDQTTSSSSTTTTAAATVSSFTSSASILQPKAFERTFKALEVRESKSSATGETSTAAGTVPLLSEEDELSADEADDDYQADYYGSENESDDDGNDLGDVF